MDAGTYYINKTLVIYSNPALRLADDATAMWTDNANIMLRSEQDGVDGDASGVGRETAIRTM